MARKAHRPMGLSAIPVEVAHDGTELSVGLRLITPRDVGRIYRLSMSPGQARLLARFLTEHADEADRDIVRNLQGQ